MKRLWEKGKRGLLAVAITGIISFLVFAMYHTYHAYLHMIVQQQQQHLMLIARAVSQSLELNISKQLREVSILTQTPGFVDAMEEHYETGETEKIKEYIFSYMLSDQGGPSRMYLLNDGGEQIFHYNQYPFLEEFDESLLRLQTSASESAGGIGTVFPISESRYGMTLINSVYGGGKYLGTVVSVIDLQAMFEQYISPLNVGRAGHISVKDEYGTVIMHDNSRLLGFNYERDIPEFDSLKQYEMQRNMIKAQYRQEEGTAVYDAYSHGIAVPEKEISSFSRMNLWGTSWYISAVTPYSQAMAEEVGSLRRFSLLFFSILTVMMTAGVSIYLLSRKRQKLELETRYLKEINSTLEELYQSREEVRHYQKLTTIGTLAGGIAHEFNNLLTPILGYAEFLKEQLGQDSEYYQDIEEVYKAGVRAKEIVEQILPFSRKETDTAGYRSINLDTIIRDAAKMVGLIMPSNIQIQEKLDDKGANVYGNATQLHQVLLNLYSNAIHSMEGTGGILTVSTRRLKMEQLPKEYHGIAGPEYVEIQVEDTGCGMSESIMHQIFNPFFTTKAVGEGTGLGLSVVQDILIGHEGLIRVESEPEKGSRFYIYLPVSEGILTMQTAVAEVSHEAADGISILLVDDEERIIKYMKKRLERKGYRADGYRNPIEALEAIMQNPKKWNVVVVDYMMPQMKGTTLAQRIKIQRPDIGIIMVTGLVESDALQMRQTEVIGEILMKPVDFDELAEAIEKTAAGSGRNKIGLERGDGYEGKE